MEFTIDSQKTLEVIERMNFAKIGKHSKWKSMAKKIKNRQPLSSDEIEYYTSMTRIYKNSTITNRSKIYHTRLSEHDKKPSCKMCGDKSSYYCNMNDQYFCTIHIVGHDKNEF